MEQILIYSWKRFWGRREGSYRTDSAGFLLDPDEDFGRLMNPEAKSFADIVAVPCLGLVGERGIGKSEALKYEYAIFKETVSQSGGRLPQLVDLNVVSGVADLDRDIFTKDWFQDWLHSQDVLHLSWIPLMRRQPLSHRLRVD
jgi:hypothetical protein